MFEAERRDLVESLRRKGITDEKVLEAMMNVERHLFVPEGIRQHAYDDTALPIGWGQTISQPYTVAVMTQALEIQDEEKVLEIGTGSGYQAAILAEMGCRVFSIEKKREIYERTQRLFERIHIRAALRCSDGTLGWEEFAPYDRIIVTAGSPKIPKALKKQLKEGGILVIPVGDKSSQSLKILKKISEEEFAVKEIPRFAFVPLIGKDGWKDA